MYKYANKIIYSFRIKKPLKTISIHLYTMKASTLNIYTLMFTLAPCANK